MGVANGNGTTTTFTVDLCQNDEYMSAARRNSSNGLDCNFTGIMTGKNTASGTVFCADSAAIGWSAIITGR